MSCSVFLRTKHFSVGHRYSLWDIDPPFLGHKHFPWDVTIFFWDIDILFGTMTFSLSDIITFSWVYPRWDGGPPRWDGGPLSVGTAVPPRWDSGPSP